MVGEKEKYKKFCKENYVPVFSKPWWMDAVCGEDNWDVWVYGTDDTEICAALPYYVEYRGNYKYITKALLTQVNGLYIHYPEGQKIAARQAFEEKIENAAMSFIESQNLDVYEQQYRYAFHNFLPFFWRGYSIIPRFTYVISDTSDLQKVENNFTANCRKNMRKGYKNLTRIEGVSKEKFYEEHEKIYTRQGLNCPFSYSFWEKLHDACVQNNSGKSIAAKDAEGNILSLMFIVWDEKSLYPLLGGAIPGYANLQTYTALTHKSITIAHEMDLMYDFEGSVIKRINHAFREYGGTPKQYFRIRKVFNPEIIRAEAEEQIRNLNPK